MAIGFNVGCVLLMETYSLTVIIGWSIEMKFRCSLKQEYASYLILLETSCKKVYTHIVIVHLFTRPNGEYLAILNGRWVLIFNSIEYFNKDGNVVQDLPHY